MKDKLAERLSTSDAALDGSYYNMFGLPTPGSDAEQIVKLPISSLDEFDGDPFRDRDGLEALRLADSIAKAGLIYPLVVRPKPGERFEILAGRRRKNAYLHLGLDEIDSIIRNVDDDQAAMIVTDSNLKQREKLLISERAYAYRMQVEALSRQGQRTDLMDEETSARFAQKTSREIVAELNEVSKDEIQRYIRITYLIPELIAIVDQEKRDHLSLYAAYHLSYLDEAAQRTVWDICYGESASSGKRPDEKTAAYLRQVFEQKHTLDSSEILGLLESDKPLPPKRFSISTRKIQEYVGQEIDYAALEDLFLEFLKLRYKDGAA